MGFTDDGRRDLSRALFTYAYRLRSNTVARRGLDDAVSDK